jgi:receptor protein-tyrosine kinase
VGQTNVVEVTVQDASDVLAAQAANAYAQAYITSQRAEVVANLEAGAKQISTKVAALQTQITSIRAQIVAATSQPGGGNPSTNAGLENQEAALLAQQSTLQSQATELLDNANLTNGGGQIVSSAVPDSTPVSPKPLTDAIIAGSVALILGIALVLIRDLLDDRIRTETDLQSAIGTLPALGMIPIVPEWAGTGSDHQARVTAGPMAHSAASEAYRALRTSLQVLRMEGGLRTIVISSPVANDGKTTTVANLASAMSQAGQRVIVVGCDLRKPETHLSFGLRNDVGFTSVILGDATLQEAIHDVSDLGSLKVLTAGPIPPNPSELLGSVRCEQLLKVLADAADIVLIDTPPVLPVTDAAILGGKADATVLVLSAGQTTKKETRRAIDILDQVSAAPLGVIVNRVPAGTGYFYYSYGYGYGYGSGPSTPSARHQAAASDTGQVPAEGSFDRALVRRRGRRGSGPYPAVTDAGLDL